MTRPITEKYEIIENTLDKISKKPRTKSTYRSYINRYFKILNVKNPNDYLTTNRNYTDDIWKVAKAIEDAPAKTQQTFISAVKRFLRRLDVDIKEREWEDIASRNGLKKVYALTDDIIPKASQLKQLLQLASPKIKVLVLFLATTGCRLGEALQVTWRDIDMDERKVRLSGEITKSGMKRYTFFTEETRDALQAWKRERQRYMTHSMRKSIFVRNKLARDGFIIKKEGKEWYIYKDGERVDRKKIIELDRRVFPFSPFTAQSAWIALLEKAGSPYNEKDNNPKFKLPRYRFHIHCLRKFWFHSFQNTGANKNHIDFIGGHQSLLDATYTDFLHDSGRLKETYDQFSSCLAIFEAQPDLSSVNEQLREKDEQIRKIQENMKIMQLTMQSMKNELEIEKIKNGKH